MTKEVYLAGTMSERNNYGVSWRRRVQKWLTRRGEVSFSPPEREHAYLIKYDIRPSQLRKRNTGMAPVTEDQLFDEIRTFDFDQIRHRTKYVIAYYTDHTDGTISEMSFARYFRIPVYIVTKKAMSRWTRSTRVGGKRFSTFEQLYNFLKVKYRLKVTKK